LSAAHRSSAGLFDGPVLTFRGTLRRKAALRQDLSRRASATASGTGTGFSSAIIPPLHRPTTPYRPDTVGGQSSTAIPHHHADNKKPPSDHSGGGFSALCADKPAHTSDLCAPRRGCNESRRGHLSRRGSPGLSDEPVPHRQRARARRRLLRDPGRVGGGTSLEGDNRPFLSVSPHELILKTATQASS
jgi:hypothetical protein